MRNSIFLLFGFFLFGCSRPSHLDYDQLKAEPFYKKEVRNGVKFNIRLRHKLFRYNFDNSPYTGSVIDYFEHTRKVKVEGEFKDGFPEGKWIYYTQDGKIETEGNFKGGVADSVWKYYYKNGSPSMIENYSLRGDTLQRDTIALWYYNGKPMLETNKDTLRTYHKTGRLAFERWGEKGTYERGYSESGLLILRTTDFKKVVYDNYGLVKKTVYYLMDERGRNLFKKEKFSWSKEQEADIANADSVEFDNSNKFDPLLKIYVR